MRKEERRIRKKKEEANTTQYGERFGHETGRHGSVRSKHQIDVSPRSSAPSQEAQQAPTSAWLKTL